MFIQIRSFCSLKKRNSETDMTLITKKMFPKKNCEKIKAYG